MLWQLHQSDRQRRGEKEEEQSANNGSTMLTLEQQTALSRKYTYVYLITAAGVLLSLLPPLQDSRPQLSLRESVVSFTNF